MHFPKSCLINEGRTRPARRCRAREARALCVVRWGEGGGGGGFYFFPLFLKRMTATKFSPLDPLFRCTPPAHPASGLRTLSPPPAPARRRRRRPPPRAPAAQPAPSGDGCRRGGPGSRAPSLAAAATARWGHRSGGRERGGRARGRRAGRGRGGRGRARGGGVWPLTSFSSQTAWFPVRTSLFIQKKKKERALL